MAEPSNSVSSIDVNVGEFAPGSASAKDASAGKGAVKEGLIGAAPGGVMAGAAAVSSVCTTPWSAPICATMLAIFGTMAAVGGTIGATHGGSAGSMKAQAQHALDEAIKQSGVQNELARQVADYGSAFTNRRFILGSSASNATPHADAVLDVGLIKVDGIEVQAGFWHFDSTHYAVSMETRARLKRSSDGAVIADRTYRYVSMPRTPQDWSSNDGKMLSSTLNNGYQQLSEWIIDDFFLLIPPLKAAQTPNKTSDSPGLGQATTSNYAEHSPTAMPIAIDPRVNFCMPIVVPGVSAVNPLLLPIDLLFAFGHAAVKKPCDFTSDYYTVAFLIPVRVDSLRPTLRWNFNADLLRPNLNDSHAGSSKPSPVAPTDTAGTAISNLRYEVLVLPTEVSPRTGDRKRKEIRAVLPAVYKKTGLIEPSHQLEQDLAPCSRYLWTARALFELDGVAHSTEWAGHYWNLGDFEPARLRIASLNEHSTLMNGKPFDYAFPFSTPCEGQPGDETNTAINQESGFAASPAATAKTFPGQSSEASPTTAASIPSPANAPLSDSIEGAFMGKEARKGGLAGLAMGIDIKFSITNKTGKDISRIEGNARLFDDNGHDLGTFSLHSDQKIPAHGNIEIVRTIFPIFFSNYIKLKDMSWEKINAELTFESIEFSDATLPDSAINKPAPEQARGGVESVPGGSGPPSPETVPSDSVEGTFLGKEMKKEGLAGLAMGIDVRISLANKTGKTISRIVGKVRLYDDSGHDIGTISFHSEKRVPGYGNIEITKDIYPLLFPGYTKMKELSLEKIMADFTFDSIEFATDNKTPK